MPLNRLDAQDTYYPETPVTLLHSCQVKLYFMWTEVSVAQATVVKKSTDAKIQQK